MFSISSTGQQILSGIKPVFVKLSNNVVILGYIGKMGSICVRLRISEMFAGIITAKMFRVWLKCQAE